MMSALARRADDAALALRRERRCSQREGLRHQALSGVGHHLQRSVNAQVNFACIHNAGRFQMAAAFINQPADRTGAEAVSAGTDPGLRVHPEVQTTMQEVGIDLTNAKPQKLTQELANDATLLITMGCGDNYPYVPGLRRDDWTLKDPNGLPVEEVRVIRDDIKSRVTELINREHFA